MKILQKDNCFFCKTSNGKTDHSKSKTLLIERNVGTQSNPNKPFWVAVSLILVFLLFIGLLEGLLSLILTR